MRPIPSPAPLLKAAFAVIFLILDFCLFITAAVAWSHHRHLCVTEWADVLRYGVWIDDIPFVFCGIVRWFPYALLVAVSFIGFFVAAGYFAAAFLKPRDHQRGTCTATLIFLTLLLLTIIVGWTPPGEFITTGLIADRSSFPPHTEPALAPPLDHLSTRSDHERELEEMLHAHENLKHKEKRQTWEEDKDLEDLITKYLEVEASSTIEEDAGSHRHLNGLHGITGAFLINAHYPEIGSLNGAVILAHLTFFVGVLLAVFDCILPDGKPDHHGPDGKRDSVGSEM